MTKCKNHCDDPKCVHAANCDMRWCSNLYTGLGGPQFCCKTLKDAHRAPSSPPTNVDWKKMEIRPKTVEDQLEEALRMIEKLKLEIEFNNYKDCVFCGR